LLMDEEAGTSIKLSGIIIWKVLLLILRQSLFVNLQDLTYFGNFEIWAHMCQVIQGCLSTLCHLCGG
jgi:hypothetical protein